jgi:hypothetical protein
MRKDSIFAYILAVQGGNFFEKRYGTVTSARETGKLAKNALASLSLHNKVIFFAFLHQQVFSVEQHIGRY